MGNRSSSGWGVWFFDCDGVLLDSNGVKSGAFHRVALRYGSDVADAVLAHHIAHGGVSRFVKLERIFTELLDRPAAAGEYDELLAGFAEQTRRSLLDVSADADAVKVLSMLEKAGVGRHVVSGGLEEEVEWALVRHGIADHFDGIHGSPRPKREILSSVIEQARARSESCVMVGDSELDMVVAAECGLERVFVSHWTEFADWQGFVRSEPRILVVHDLAELHDVLTGDARLNPSRDLDWVPSFT